MGCYPRTAFVDLAIFFFLPNFASAFHKHPTGDVKELEPELKELRVTSRRAASRKGRPRSRLL
jgi:hypothetical protein